MAAKSNFTAYTVPMFQFERDFDHDRFHIWTVENWTVTIWYSFFYVIAVFGGRYYMNNRPKFELRLPLALWSLFLAIFSIFGAIRTAPELVYMIRRYGFESSICNPSYFYGPTAFWAYTFVTSKIYELGDTAFIILRKQPLIFLHWYHHASVMIYVFYSYTDHTAPGRWFMVMNYVVHSFMYSYYALRAMRFRVPKFVSMFITSLQICQMIMGMVVIIKAYEYKEAGHFCQQTKENMRYCFIMYASYFILFGYFFYGAYIAPRPAPVKPVKECANGVADHANGIAAKKQQ